MSTFGDTFGKTWVPLGSKLNQIKICVTGDSIVRGVDGGLNVAEILASLDSRLLATNIAEPSEGTVEQLGHWDDLTTDQKQSFDYIISVNGNNIINYLTPVATSITMYQTLIDNIKEDIKSNCKIIVCTLTPAQDVFVAIYPGHDAEILANRQGFNEAVKGNGTSPLTKSDLLITSFTDSLDDGAYSLKSEYWRTSGDHLHPNVAGRTVIANAILEILNLYLEKTMIGSPSNLSLTSKAWNQVAIEWINGTNNLDGFKVERSTDGINFSVINTRLNGLSSFTDLTVDFDTTYYYRVRGFKKTEYTDYTETLEVTTDSAPEMINQSQWFNISYWNIAHEANWSSDGSKLISSSTSSGSIAKSGFFTSGLKYRLSWSMTRVAGTLRILDNGVNLIATKTATGDYYVDYIPTGSYLLFQGLNFNGTITAMSYKRIH